MKLLTANFITCAVKTCKSSPLSFPLHFRDAELEQRELDYNPVFLANILPRLDWDAIKAVAAEVSFFFFFCNRIASFSIFFFYIYFFLVVKTLKGLTRKFEEGFGWNEFVVGILDPSNRETRSSSSSPTSSLYWPSTVARRSRRRRRRRSNAVNTF